MVEHDSDPADGEVAGPSSGAPTNLFGPARTPLTLSPADQIKIVPQLKYSSAVFVI